MIYFDVDLPDFCFSRANKVRSRDRVLVSVDSTSEQLATSRPNAFYPCLAPAMEAPEPTAEEAGSPTKTADAPSPVRR